MTAYVLEGPRWGTGALGTSGGTVTWAVDATVPASFLSDITSAFAEWSSYGNITFSRISSTQSANISFANSYIDGANGTLGYAEYSYIGQRFTSVDITFDSGENWRAANGDVVSASGADLYQVALHEIGHAIGLDHYNAAPAVMNSYLDSTTSSLTQSEISGIRALYGAAPTPPVAPVSLPVLAVTFTGTDAGDVLTGNILDNVMTGGQGSDDIRGGDGADIIYGGIGISDPSDSGDHIFGGNGADQIFGAGGDDTLYGNAGTDVLYGGRGRDTIYGGDGVADPYDANDVIFGGEDGDIIFGNGGDDVIYGGTGPGDPIDAGDVIHGGAGKDVIYGNGGNDVLFGDGGDDALFGGLGNNTLTGGIGADRFYISPSQDRNTIADFNLAEGDRLYLQGQSYTASAVDGGTELALLNGGFVVLVGVTLQTFQADQGSFFS